MASSPVLTVPIIPDTAPFTAEQRAWLNGYLAGLFARGPVNTAAGAAPSCPPSVHTLTPPTILFRSQTGTAEALAKHAAKDAGKRGFAATVVDMAQTDTARLATEKNVLVIVSTFGNGDPPDNARPLHAALQSAVERLTLSRAAAMPPGPGRSDGPLSGLRYSVCALGDTNYVQFCKCGQDFDSFLEIAGATRIAPRVDCDLDFEAKFSTWLDAALAALNDSPAGHPAATAQPEMANTAPKVAEPAAAYTRQKPFPALVLSSRRLSGTDSAKEVQHIEFDLTGSGLTYEAGDALGVFPQNCPELVAEVLTVLGCDGEEAVPAPDGTTVPLRRALTECYDLSRPTADLAAHYGRGGGGVAIAPGQIIDLLLARADIKLGAVDFVGALQKLQPRLYSISSSPKAHAGQVHLTVGAIRYEAAGRARKGVCSTFLADRVVAGTSRPGVFVHRNANFRVPASGDTAMIMVGPGTGIAPFRAFLHERRAMGAKGRNWLFFGDQKSATDFLYRDELLAFQADAVLGRLDLAWSRDQPEKTYVQHRMLEQAAELYAWLEAGAHFYVCGDASRMARDVEATLLSVIERAGGKTPEQAAAYVQTLRTTKRYLRDVY